jgi:hypothetical protein
MQNSNGRRHHAHGQQQQQEFALDGLGENHHGLAILISG